MRIPRFDTQTGSEQIWNNGTKRLAQSNIDTNLPFVKNKKKEEEKTVSVKHNKESVEKNLPANARDVESMASVYGSGRSLGGGNGNPLLYSCLNNPMDRGA